MSWTIKISSKAERYYNRLDKELRYRIKSELQSLAEFENPLEHASVRPLTGELRAFNRLRVGNYRIIFRMLKEERIIAIVNIYPRGDAYKK